MEGVLLIGAGLFLMLVITYEQLKRVEEKVDGLIDDINDLSIDFHNHYSGPTSNDPLIIGTTTGTWSSFFTPAFSRSTQYGEEDAN